MNDPFQIQERPTVEGPSAAGDSLNGIVQDVEQFARGWIIRVRQILQRSSQLIERESLLAGAIAKLDQQKSEWTKRTREKEAGLLEQSKMLTEAWLEVEAERRKAAQGVRSVQPGNAARTVRPAAVTSPVVRPVLAEPVNGNEADEKETPTIRPAAVSNAPVMPVTPASGETVANVPINFTPSASAPENGDDADQEHAAQQRIEEFKRMQRALRSNRNR